MVFAGNAGTDVDDIGSSERAIDLPNTEGTNGAAQVMAEAGLPDQTIMAQVAHISPEMIKHYSHIRRQALNAAAVLEPAFLKTSDHKR